MLWKTVSVGNNLRVICIILVFLENFFVCNVKRKKKYVLMDTQ